MRDTLDASYRQCHCSILAWGPGPRAQFFLRGRKIIETDDFLCLIKLVRTHLLVRLFKGLRTQYVSTSPPWRRGRGADNPRYATGQDLRWTHEIRSLLILLFYWNFKMTVNNSYGDPKTPSERKFKVIKHGVSIYIHRKMKEDEMFLRLRDQRQRRMHLPGSATLRQKRDYDKNGSHVTIILS